MSALESERHALRENLAETLGPETAGKLMEHLPPVSWDKLATKDDLREVATKDDLAELSNKMATKDDLRELADKMATKDDLAALADKMATKDDLREVATRDELRAVGDKMATKDDLREVATRDELRAVGDKMATKDDLRQLGDRMDTSLSVLGKELRAEMQDGFAAMKTQSAEQLASTNMTMIGHHRMTMLTLVGTAISIIVVLVISSLA